MEVNQVICGQRTWHIETCDVLDGLRRLPDGCVQCCVTSPPYYALRDYGLAPSRWSDGWIGCLGMEPTPQQFIIHCVELFSEVDRVLRADGTLWLNIGDSYHCAKGQSGGVDSKQPARRHLRGACPNDKRLDGYKPKDMIGIPWMLAKALRRAGWYLRAEIIWSKRSPMPDSVTDRPTKSHEPIFLLTRSKRYFYDNVASAEKSVGGTPGNKTHKAKTAYENGDAHHRTKVGLTEVTAVETRNMRSVWETGPTAIDVVDWLTGRVDDLTLAQLVSEAYSIPVGDVWKLSTEPYRGAHFATFPSELVRRCLLAGTSERGCCAKCGAPRRRQTEKERVTTRPGTNSKVEQPGAGWSHDNDDENGRVQAYKDPQRHVTRTTTTGWEDGCECKADSVGCLVLDPFGGAGTTPMVARKMGCRAIAFELNPDYTGMARKRILDDQPLLNAV